MVGSLDQANSSRLESKSEEALLDFAVKYLVAKDAKCYRHCQRPAKFVPISKRKGTLVGAYVCPDNYVSRVVYFAVQPDAGWFEEFLTRQAGKSRVRPQDIRLATRYGWELGGDAEKEVSSVSDTGRLKQYYWTFYPKSEEDKKAGTFLCSSCDSNLFTKLLSDDEKFCLNCREKTRTRT
jgi:hypothetical protein